MYRFKRAVRVETNNGWTYGIQQTLTDPAQPLPLHVRPLGETKHGFWYRFELPASVWALVVKSDEGITAGIYHSPAAADDELKEVFDVAKPAKA
jgi:hypothetical protein